MRVYVSVDMEGVAGVVDPKQLTRSGDDYAMARALMAGEANAAVAGAFDAGATAVVVNDAHGDMRNLLPEDLDPRSELVSGSLKLPYGMVQGSDGGFDVALFVGYHAAAGTASSALDHSYAGRVVHDLRVNGESWGELSFNALLVGAFGVPVGMVTGDEQFCAQAAEALPGVEVVVVKRAFGRLASQGLHPAQARALIQAAARDVVGRASDLRPFVVPPPYRLELDTFTTAMADVCELVPGSDRLGPRTVGYRVDTPIDLVRCRMAWTTLAATVLA